MKNRAIYLSALGLTAWQLRHPRTDLSYKALIYEGDNEIGLVIVNQSLTDESMGLLQKIFGIMAYKVGNFTTDPLIPKTMNVVITFGANSFEGGDCAEVNLPSLNDMLVNPSLKRIAWETLKKYLNLVKN